MAASADTVNRDKPCSTDGWTVVLPRRGRLKKNNSSKIVNSEEQSRALPWTPLDLGTDSEREAKLMRIIQTCIQKLEKSEFWSTFLSQYHTDEVSDMIKRVLGSEDKACMVIYGIGSIESSESPRLQLSLAILMKRTFNWIGEIEVFDPVISLIESRVLTTLGCSVLSVNEHGRRQALKPTLFFMPHCETELYNNLLQENWRADLLNRIILLGNSFEAYEEQRTLTFSKTMNYILATRKFYKEVPIVCSDDYFRAFNTSSWHFFSLDSDPSLEIC